MKFTKVKYLFLDLLQTLIFKKLHTLVNFEASQFFKKDHNLKERTRRNGKI